MLYCKVLRPRDGRRTFDGVPDTTSAYLVHDDGFVPKERYVSRDFFDLELDRLWARVWQIAGREEEIPDVGDYLEYTIGDQSILIVRVAPDAVKAYSNACLHRGTRLAEGHGSFGDGTIRCRFHSWQYALDGRLVDVVDAHEFSLPEGLCLPEVRLDRWGGFLFVNLDPDAEPLLEFLDPLPELLAPYHFDELRFRS